MRKIFTFLFAALMSVSMFGATTVTWNTNDITGSGKSFTKDGVTITVAYDINFEQKNFEGGGTFTTTLGNFTKIEVTADDVYTVSGDGWSGDIAKKTWTGNASSVSFTDNIYGNGGDITFVFTIEPAAPADPNREYLSLDPSVWGWGYNSVSGSVEGGLQTTIISDWGAVSTGWDPTRDLSEWDKIVFEVSHMDGCAGNWFKLKAYLRDETESEDNQMEGLLGNEAPDNELNYLVIDLHQDKACDITKARILAVQCEPTGGIFTISSAYLLKEEAPTTYTLQLVADPEKGSVAVTNLLGSDIIDNGNGNYTVPENAEVTILATPLEGYEFSGWKVGNIEEMVGCYYCGTAVNTEDNPYTFTMTADVAYLAEFEEAQGIENIVLTEKAKKVVVDGVIYIVRDGKLFNVTGAQVK